MSYSWDFSITLFIFGWLAIFAVIATLITIQIFMQAANAQTFGIGVSPTLVNITAVYGQNTTVPFYFWNEGDTDAMFTIDIEQSLLDYMDIGNPDYFHGENFTVGNKTTVSTGVVKEMLFRGKIDERIGKFQTGLTVYGSPIGLNNSGTITMRRGIYVMMFVENYPAPATSTTTTTAVPAQATTTSVAQQGGSSQSNWTYTYTSTSHAPSTSATTTTTSLLPSTTTTSATMTTTTESDLEEKESLVSFWVKVALAIAVMILVYAVVRWWW